MRAYTALVKQVEHIARAAGLLSSHRGRVLARIAELKLALKLIDSKIDFYASDCDWKRPKSLPSARSTTAPKRPRGRRFEA